MASSAAPAAYPGSPTLEQVVKALLGRGRALMLRSWAPQSCVAGTRIVIDLLAHYGYRARPLVVEARAFNRPAADAIESGARGLVEGGYCVSLGSDEQGQRGLHLVAISGNMLIDIALDQVARPGWNLVAYPSAFVLREPLAFATGSAEAWFDLPAGGAIGYRALPDRRHYVGSSDWGRPRRAARRVVLDELIRYLEGR